MFVDKDLVKRMKAQYSPKTRNGLEGMGDDSRPIEPGTRGAVGIVDDMGTVYLDGGEAG